MKLARVATIAVATTGLAGCINSNVAVGDNNEQTIGDDSDASRRTRCADDPRATVGPRFDFPVCRAYHEHTDQCIKPSTQVEPCDARWFTSQPVASNYLNKSQFFACNDFEDRNGNGIWEAQEILGGPRDTFRTDEKIALVGWELSEKKLDVTVYDDLGNKLFQKNFQGHRGGHRVRYQPHALPAGTYTIRWERDECGLGQWTEQARQTITVVDCTRAERESPSMRPPRQYSGSGVVESIK